MNCGEAAALCESAEQRLHAVKEALAAKTSAAAFKADGEYIADIVASLARVIEALAEAVRP